MTRRTSWVIAAAALICAVLLPGRYYYGFRSVEDGRDIGFPIRVIEGRTGVLSVFGDGSFELNNAKYTGGLASGAWGDIGYSAELVVGRPIKRALVIGAGHGDVIVAFANLPGNPIVDVAELSDEVIAVQRDPAMAKSGREYFRGAYGVDVHVIDGRRWVNEGLARGLRYDVIQLGINNPSTGTSGNLYTREMFEKMHELLADDGVLMVYSFGSALRTGLEVFAHVYYLSGIPHVAAFTGQVFMTKRPVQSPVWRDAALGQLVETCNSRSHRDGESLGCSTAITPEAEPALNEVPRALVAHFPSNEDDTVIMTFNKLWRRSHPFPSQRQVLGLQIDPSALRPTPVVRAN